MLRDCLEAEAGFLLVHLIKAALLGEHAAPSPRTVTPPPELPPQAATACRRVVLLAAAQTVSHYSAVLRKAGLSLPALTGAGQLAVVELLPVLAGGLPSLRDVHALLAAASTCEAAAGSGSMGGLCLVVDDLTVSSTRMDRGAKQSGRSKSQDACGARPVVAARIGEAPLAHAVPLPSAGAATTSTIARPAYARAGCPHSAGAALPGRQPGRLGRLPACLPGCGAGAVPRTGRRQFSGTVHRAAGTHAWLASAGQYEYGIARAAIRGPVLPCRPLAAHLLGWLTQGSPTTMPGWHGWSTLHR